MIFWIINITVVLHYTQLILLISRTIASKWDIKMGKEQTIYQLQDIEKKNEDVDKYSIENEGNSDSFLKLIAEIIVEIIIKETSDERNRVRQEK